MPQHPMSGPDPSTPPPGATGVLRAQPDDASFETDFADLAARFSASSGGGLSPELSADLALEIVLNEIVEQACVTTGATGAAVVLQRDGEMMCRASSGTTAPELGARLDTASGLSGECIKSRQTQRCDDVLVDARADVAASQRLGVRSVIVIPLLRGADLLGVVELLSSEPYAFGERDEGTLEILAGRILSALECAGHVAATPVNPAVSADPNAAEAAAAAEAEQEIAPQILEQLLPRRFDFATWALGAAVIVCAVMLGMLLGPHYTAQKTTRAHRVVTRAATSAISSSVATDMPTAPVQAKAPGRAVTPAAARPAAVKASSAPAVPAGGLRVYDNGKEVFWLPPAENAGADVSDDAGIERAASLEPEQDTEGVVELSPAAAEGSLLRRVEPMYPEDARQQGIQGPVVLEVHMGADGGVQDVQVVTGPEQLIGAATTAVKQWRFKPRTVKGRPVEMQTTVTLNFRLPK